MLTFLIAVDGSDWSDHAVEYVLKRAGQSRDTVMVHLLNVQAPLVGVNVKLFIKQDSLDSYYREEGLAALKTAREKLAASHVAHEHHIGVGDPGKVIVEYAGAKACDEIVMGTHGRGALTGAIMGSVAQKVVHQAHRPVVLVK